MVQHYLSSTLCLFSSPPPPFPPLSLCLSVSLSLSLSVSLYLSQALSLIPSPFLLSLSLSFLLNLLNTPNFSLSPLSPLFFTHILSLLLSLLTHLSLSSRYTLKFFHHFFPLPLGSFPVPPPLSFFPSQSL